MQTTVTTTVQGGTSSATLRSISILRSLTIAELIIQVIIVLLTAIALILQRNLIPIFNIAEGIWLSVFPLIAAGLGIGAAKTPINNCLLTGHMVMAILSTLTSFVLFCIEITYTIFSAGLRLAASSALLSLLTIAAFVQFILFIVSSSYVCKVQSRGCCGCCGGEMTTTTQEVTYVNQPSAGTKQEPIVPPPYTT